MYQIVLTVPAKVNTLLFLFLNFFKKYLERKIDTNFGAFGG